MKYFREGKSAWIPTPVKSWADMNIGLLKNNWEIDKEMVTYVVTSNGLAKLPPLLPSHAIDIWHEDSVCNCQCSTFSKKKINIYIYSKKLFLICIKIEENKEKILIFFL